MFNVEEFHSLSDKQIRLKFMCRGCTCEGDKCRYCNDDVCSITLTTAKSLKYPALANDGRIYDAFALKSWLQYQTSDNFYIIPGNKITSITPLSMTDYFKTIWKKIELNYIVNGNKRSKVTSSTQTDFNLASTRVEVPLPQHCNHRGLRRGLHAYLPRKIRHNASSYSAYIVENKVLIMSNNTLNDRQRIMQVL